MKNGELNPCFIQTFFLNRACQIMTSQLYQRMYITKVYTDKLYTLHHYSIIPDNQPHALLNESKHCKNICILIKKFANYGWQLSSPKQMPHELLRKYKTVLYIDFLIEKIEFISLHHYSVHSVNDSIKGMKYVSLRIVLKNTTCFFFWFTTNKYLK